ncbi:hypothetical protein KAR34_12150 [bacterium]|nr:hypothetical protein [bacterium]
MSLKKTIYDVIKLYIPGIVIWICVCVLFGINGVFGDFYDVVFKALKNYAGNIFVNEIYHLISMLRLVYEPVFKELVILMILSIVWIVWKNKYENSKFKLLMALYFVGQMLMIGAVRDRGVYYYQIILASVCLMPMLLMFAFDKYLKSRNTGKKIVLVCFAIIFGYVICFQWPYIWMTSQEFAIKTSTNKTVKERELGKLLAGITGPDEKIYQWGGASTLYFYSKREAASGIVNNHILFFTEKDMTLKYMNKIINDLLTNKPAFFIFTSWLGQIKNHKVFGAIKHNYRYFGSFGKNVIYERFGREDRFENELEKMMNESEEYGYRPKDKLRLALDTSVVNEEVLFSEPKKYIEVEGQGRYSRYVNNGIVFANSGEFDEASSVWFAAKKMRPDKYEAHANIAILAQRQNKLNDAIDGFECLATKYGSPWTEYYRSAILDLEQEAKEVLSEPTKKNIKMTHRILMNAQGTEEYANLVNLGIKAVQEKKIYAAEKYWIKARRLQPDRPEARANLAVLMERSRKFEQALKEYKYAAEKLGAPWNKYYEELKGFIEKQ